MPVLHMFIDLARSAKISAFNLPGYEKLLKETRKMIQAKIFFRRKVADVTENCLVQMSMTCQMDVSARSLRREKQRH